MSYNSLPSSTPSGASQRWSDGESISSTRPNSHLLEQQIARAFSSGRVLDAPELMKAVMELQQENVNLRRENTDLETQIVDLKLQLKADKTSNPTGSIEQEMKTDVARAAKFFLVFMSPSIAANAFKVNKPTFLYNSPERYNDGQALYGIAAELHHSIPEKYLSYLSKHELLAKEFLSYLSMGRSSALDRFRKNASWVFNSESKSPEGHSNLTRSELDQALFATGVKRSQNERICELLGIDSNGGKTFSALPPILFSRENPNVMSRLFLHPSLFKLTWLIVYGPTSLDQKNPEKLTMHTNNTYFHPITKLAPTVTPGFISWMCMMTCYMLSDDTEFNSSGIRNVTGVEYLVNYELYKQTLIEGFATGKSHFSDLFVTWNREVFPRSQVSEVVPDSQPASCSGGGNMGGFNVNNVANILKQLSFEEGDNDEEEESDNRSDYYGHHHSGSNSDNNDDFYMSNTPHTQSMTPVVMVVPSSQVTNSTSTTIVNAIVEPTHIQTTPLPTLNTHLVDEVLPHDQQSVQGLSKASESAPPKKSTQIQTTRRSSSRTTKAKAAAGNTNSNLPGPVPAPVSDTAGVIPLPKPKRATRGTAKGKMRA